MKRTRQEFEKDQKSTKKAQKKVKLNYNGVWISQLPQKTTIEELKKYVNEFGKIEKIVLFRDKSSISIDSNTAAGITIDGNIVDDVLDYNGATILGSKIQVRYLKQQDFIVDIKGIDETECSIDDLKTIIETDVGETKEIKKISETRYSVEFDDLEKVKEVLLYSGSDINGQTIEILYKF